MGGLRELVLRRNLNRRALELCVEMEKRFDTIKVHGENAVVLLDAPGDTVVKLVNSMKERTLTAIMFRALEPEVEIRGLFGPVGCERLGIFGEKYGVMRSFMPMYRTPRLAKNDAERADMIGAFHRLLVRMIDAGIFIRRSPFELNSVGYIPLDDFMRDVSYCPAEKRMHVSSAGSMEILDKDTIIFACVSAIMLLQEYSRTILR